MSKNSSPVTGEMYEVVKPKIMSHRYIRSITSSIYQNGVTCTYASAYSNETSNGVIKAL